MKITFYGVRGSIPVSGPDTLKFGGDTSCVHIKLNNGTDVILDAGTGIRKLGQTMLDSKTPINILMSHRHWDHILGFPFFEPIYQKDRPVSIYPSEPDIHVKLCSLMSQMDGAHFPVSAKELPSETKCVMLNIEEVLLARGVNVTRQALNHPGGGYAYRIEEDDVSCAYVTDNELWPPGNGKTTIALAIAKLLSGTDPIWMPYSITAGGQIIQINDRLVHKQIPLERAAQLSLGVLTSAGP